MAKNDPLANPANSGQSAARARAKGRRCPPLQLAPAHAWPAHGSDNSAHYYPKELLNEFDRIAKENKKTAVYNDLVVWRYGCKVHQAFLRRVPSVCVFHKKSIIDFKNTKIHDELGIVFEPKTMVRLKATNKTSLNLFQDESS